MHVGDAPPPVAVIVTVWFDATALGVTANVALIDPAGIVTLAGTVSALVLLLDSVTTKPPVGAGALIVTVPVTLVPIRPVVGLTDTAEAAGGVTVNVADFELPDTVAVMVAMVFALTELVVTVAVVDVAPAGTVTVAGTLAEPLLLERATVTPAAPAAALSVIVAVEFCAPPRTLVGPSVSVETVYGLSVRLADAVIPFAAIEIDAVVTTETCDVAMVNVPVLAPAATVAVAGTEAAALLLESATTRPPAGATEFSVIVPVIAADPPTTAVGLRARPLGPMTLTTTLADFVDPFSVDVRVTVLAVATACDITVAVAIVDPAGTVTVAGTESAGSLLASDTDTPPTGAATFRVTVAVVFWLPPNSVPDATVIVDNTIG
jgi:hypothetical protein